MMIKMSSKNIFFIICILLMIFSSIIIYSETSNEIIKNNRHPSLKLLKEKIKNVITYNEAIKIITSMYGKPTRYIGSGLIYPQWDINGGILTCHPNTGVVFSKSDYNIFDDNAIYLIDTENKVEENIIGTYMMWTVPKSESNNQKYLIGYLELNINGNYTFKDDRIKEQDYNQDNNFFINNPTGSFTIEYLNGINADSLLEDMKSGTILLKLKLTSGSKVETLYLVIKGRTIISKSINNKLTFDLYKFWKRNYYHPTNEISFDLLKIKLKNARSYQEAYNIIENFYGAPKRDVGDGILYIPQWDIEGGVLTCHNYEGVSYYKDGKTTYLIDTQNKVEKTIIGYYALYTLIPGDKDTIGSSLGAGLTLGTNGQYKLKTFGKDYLIKDNQNDVFFFRYPSGTYTLTYQKGINPDELLENMKDGTVLGKIDFASGRNRESFYIYIKERRLVSKPVDGKPRTYLLHKYWENYYQKNERTK